MHNRNHKKLFFTLTILFGMVLVGVAAVASSLYQRQNQTSLAPNAPASQPEAALTNTCTYTFTIAASPTSTPTNRPTPTPTISPVCNSTCRTNAQCQAANPNWICKLQDNCTGFNCPIGNCRLASNPLNEQCLPVSPSPTPTTPPTPTNSPTASPTTAPVCDSTCRTNAQCQAVNPNWICKFRNDCTGVTCPIGNCRLASNDTSTQCLPPTASPTASPTSTPAPLCISISMSSNSGSGVLNPGTQVTFTCGQVAGANRYEFRVILPGKQIVSLQPTIAGSRVSQVYTLPNTGTFGAQCRICTGAAGETCTAWEELPF